MLNRLLARQLGKEFRVLPTGTNLNWMLIRIRADTLAPSSAPNSFPLNSTANVYPDVVQKFALNTLDEYLKTVTGKATHANADTAEKPPGKGAKRGRKKASQPS